MVVDLLLMKVSWLSLAAGIARSGCDCGCCGWGCLVLGVLAVYLVCGSPFSPFPQVILAF